MALATADVCLKAASFELRIDIVGPPGHLDIRLGSRLERNEQRPSGRGIYEG